MHKRRPHFDIVENIQPYELKALGIIAEASTAVYVAWVNLHFHSRWLEEFKMANTPSEYPIGHLAIGYPRLAGQMEILPETAIYRRFGALNSRNLLYYQAELASLEKELILQENLDSSVPEKQRYALDWYWLSQSVEQGDRKQLDLVMKMRALLKEYSKLLPWKQAKVYDLQGPDQWDLRDLQRFLQTPEMGPLALIGDDAMIWGSVTNPNSHSNDLVALRPRKKGDPFSGWLAVKSATALIRCGGVRWKRPSRVHGEVGYQDSTIFRITRWITTILASLIPLASVVALYFVHSLPSRLGIIGGFNLLISICLSAFTTANRAEVFAVSSAFTAVQVVFISTGNK
ncbi:uncharacterized protein BDR25DRAFT_350697 [Lindgomyces ingoldianus]|uniref:Uncharacterized protein n=1 Tax=Lindgomyces ingoldianus TaxID=673940 RepID=A0ACB6R890_9PLEO|nr:uncharacterized protein BDR25DRAFT_350697 [Lindgomyces ingoldianus]KAF2475307.1 hypothetical protein BDR25DRAFT_350697 [Lindgomyces ingoldianus]